MIHLSNVREIQNLIDKPIKNIEPSFVNSVYLTLMTNEVNIDGCIQDTQQSNKRGDCWLLTMLNCLRDSKWGAKLIKDSIKQDKNGDVVITFKGSKGPQKEFKVTKEEIISARESGCYANGDDDVIAFELALEKYYKEYGHLHDRAANDGTVGAAIDGGNAYDKHDFVNLLSGEESKSYSVFYEEDVSVNEKEQELDRILTEAFKGPDSPAIIVSFRYNTVNGKILSEHAYQVKNVVIEKNPKTGKEEKYVILVNPHDSSKEEKIGLSELAIYMRTMQVITKPGEPENDNLKSNLQLSVEYSDLIQEMLKDAQNKELWEKTVVKTNKNNIAILFFSKDIIGPIIRMLDALERGWGSGDEKKALIAPLVDAYCEYAIEKGVDSQVVDEVKKACYKELDALLYTDEDVIVEKLQLLFEEIEKASNKSKFPSYDDLIKFGL